MPAPAEGRDNAAEAARSSSPSSSSTASLGSAGAAGAGPPAQAEASHSRVKNAEHSEGPNAAAAEDGSGTEGRSPPRGDEDVPRRDLFVGVGADRPDLVAGEAGDRGAQNLPNAGRDPAPGDDRENALRGDAAARAVGEERPPLGELVPADQRQQPTPRTPSPLRRGLRSPPQIAERYARCSPSTRKLRNPLPRRLREEAASAAPGRPGGAGAISLSVTGRTAAAVQRAHAQSKGALKRLRRRRVKKEQRRIDEEQRQAEEEQRRVEKEAAALRHQQLVARVRSRCSGAVRIQRLWRGARARRRAVREQAVAAVVGALVKRVEAAAAREQVVEAVVGELMEGVEAAVAQVLVEETEDAVAAGEALTFEDNSLEFDNVLDSTNVVDSDGDLAEEEQSVVAEQRSNDKTTVHRGGGGRKVLLKAGTGVDVYRPKSKKYHRGLVLYVVGGEHTIRYVNGDVERDIDLASRGHRNSVPGDVKLLEMQLGRHLDEINRLNKETSEDVKSQQASFVAMLNGGESPNSECRKLLNELVYTNFPALRKRAKKAPSAAQKKRPSDTASSGQRRSTRPRTQRVLSASPQPNSRRKSSRNMSSANDAAQATGPRRSKRTSEKVNSPVVKPAPKKSRRRTRKTSSISYKENNSDDEGSSGAESDCEDASTEKGTAKKRPVADAEYDILKRELANTCRKHQKDGKWKGNPDAHHRLLLPQETVRGRLRAQAVEEVEVPPAEGRGFELPKR